MPLKAKKIDWRKGNGSLIFGTAIMLITLCIVMMFVQTFIIRQNARDTQLAADSIADGTAVYMANEGGDYDDAVDQAEKIQKMVNEYTGVNIGNTVTIDQTLLEEESQVQATVTSQNRYLSGSGYVSEAFKGNSYGITRSATTEFIGGGLKGFQSVLKWLEECIPYAQYSQANRTGLNTEGYITSADCSSMCWQAYKKMGCTSPLWYTDAMATLYFNEISPSQLQPGDCIVRMKAPGREGHAMLYVDDGLCFEMGGSSRSRGTDMGYCSMPMLSSGPKTEGYHCYRIKPEYML